MKAPMMRLCSSQAPNSTKQREAVLSAGLLITQKKNECTFGGFQDPLYLRASEPVLQLM